MHHLIPMTDPTQANSVVMVKRKSKTISPRSMNAMQVGYTRYDHKDASCNRERTACGETSGYHTHSTRLSGLTLLNAPTQTTWFIDDFNKPAG